MKEASIITRVKEIVRQIDRGGIPIKEFTIPCTYEELRDLKWHMRSSYDSSIRHYADTKLDSIKLYGFTINLSRKHTKSEELALKAKKLLGLSEWETDLLIEAFDKILEEI